MRKLLSAVALFLLCLMLLCSCDNGVSNKDGQSEKDTHNHTPGEWIVDAEASCTVPGVKHRVCTDADCGLTVESVLIPATGHTDGTWLPLGDDATTPCERRMFYRVCTKCNAVEQKSGTEKDHAYITVTHAPTCLAKGYDEKTCQTCGKVVKENETPLAEHAWKSAYTADASFHWFDCNDCTAINARAEHSVGEDDLCTVCDQPIGATVGVNYELSSNGTFALVVGYTGDAKHVIIADTYMDKPVKIIDSGAFENATITAVVIPNSVTSIDRWAFADCDSLASITIPASVKDISFFSFYCCDSLASIVVEQGNIVYHSAGNCLIETASKTLLVGCKNSVIPADGSVTSIGNHAFYNCTSLTSITIPASVTSIGSDAFSYCSSLTAITIPASVKSIGEGAFSHCSSLTAITIPASVASIGERAFFDCSSLASIMVEKGNTVYHSAGNCLIETASKTLLVGCKNSVIPADGSVTSIGNYAFYNCTSLTSITIPASVKSIGGGAFYNCSKLTSITIPEGVTSIGEWAFENCNKLTRTQYQNCTYIIVNANPYYLLERCDNKKLSSYQIHDDTQVIGGSAFSYCTSLTSITIPASVTSIGEWAFSDCSSLTSVTFAEGSQLTSIGDYAFYSCTSLTSITIPASVTSIGEGAFSKLETVYYAGTANDWNGISIGSNNYNLTNATRYYYSETNVAGCWHYVDGKPSLW